MKRVLLIKEIRDLLKSRTALIYFILLFMIICYSFYSGVDLYSKASVAAIDNPLYATGFEPVPGVFVPTFGGFFIILSLIAPFLLIQSISNEKKLGTLPLIVQLPYSLGFIFISKFLAAVTLILISLAFFLPVFFFWYLLGGHIPLQETSLLISGYFFYGLFVVSVSFFAASIFSATASASIFALAVIIFSWFVDFGREMNLIPFLKFFSEWTVTIRLKEFENGILSFQSIIYFILVSSFFLSLSYSLFNFNFKNKVKPIFIIIFIHLILIIPVFSIQYKWDMSESRRNSFSINHTEFLKKLPSIDIEVFLDPTDSRNKDYQHDFLKKLRMIKNDLTVHYAEGFSLKFNYGHFKYSFNYSTGDKQNKNSIETYSNSENEIFMILEELSGVKIETITDDSQYTGYPLVVKGNWSIYLFILYLIILPLSIFFLQYFRFPFYHREDQVHTE